MNLAAADSACLVGLEAAPVRVEVSLAPGLPSLSLVGLPDAAVREARDRVVAALRHSGFEVPKRKITVNLSPADLRKEGACFDLAIAVGILMASGQIPVARWPRAFWLGELALDGALRPVRGAMPIVRSLQERFKRPVVLPADSWSQVRFLPDLEAFAFASLREVADWLAQDDWTPLRGDRHFWQAEPARPAVDLSEIRGQHLARRALEIAATGHHNLLLVGPPGAGKSMLAQALPGLLPPWSFEEALSATQIHAVAGAPVGTGLLTRRPFRSPHHTSSPVALVGGGETPLPGDLSLAHHGVLFLDEWPEFRRDSIEALRQPLEEGCIHVQRARGRATFPADVLLVTAMNPCPCGFHGHTRRPCVCSESELGRYRRKLSGPILDRIDLHVHVPALSTDELLSVGGKAESSAVVRERVQAAQEFARVRSGDSKPTRNARLRGAELRRQCPLTAGARQLLSAAVDRLGFSARALDRLTRVARTIADLARSTEIQAAHMAEAVQLRALDRASGAAAPRGNH